MSRDCLHFYQRLAKRSLTYSSEDCLRSKAKTIILHSSVPILTYYRNESVIRKENYNTIVTTTLLSANILQKNKMKTIFSYPTAIQMVSSGTLKLDKLTRAHFKLEQSQDAFKKCLQGDVVKVFIHCDESS